jgi:hypothetical protein
MKLTEPKEGCPLGAMCDCDGNGEAQEYEHGDGAMRVICYCGVSGPWEPSFDEAAHGWNLLFPTPAKETR